MTYFIPKGTILYRTVENGWPCSGWHDVKSVRDVEWDVAEKHSLGAGSYYVFQLPTDETEWAQFAVKADDVKVTP